MPWLLALAPLIGAASGAAGAGLAIDQAVTAPKPQAPAPTLTPQAPSTPSTSQVSGGNSAISNITAATGGGVSPDYWIDQLQQLGLSSPIAQQVANQFIGLNAPGTSSLTPQNGTTGITPGAAPSGVVNSGINDLYQGMSLQ